MTLFFINSLGIQETRCSKDATEALKFCCLVQNAKALLCLFDLGQIPFTLNWKEILYYVLKLSSALVVYIIGPVSNLTAA